MGTVSAQEEGGFAKIEEPTSSKFSIREDINFSAADNGEGLVYIWNFGDGSAPAYGRNVSHNYTEYGTYKVTLTCVNNRSQVASDSMKIVVQGRFGFLPVYMQVCMSICCLSPFLVPVVILVIIAFILRAVLNKNTKRNWDLKPLVLAGLLLLCIPIYLVISLLTILVPVLATFLNVVIGGVLWILVGFLSVFLLKFMVKMMMNLPVGGFRNGLCIVRKPLPIEKKHFEDGSSKFSKKNYVEFVLSMTLYPLFLSFFIMSLLTDQVADPLDFFTTRNLVIILLAPFFTFLWVPIQIMLDSNLILLRKDKHQGVLIMYLGASMRELVQGLVGAGAVAAFIGIFLNFGSGGEVEQFLLAVLIMLIIVPIIYPNIFLVTMVYAAFHNRYVKKMNDKLDELNLPEYRIKEHKEDYGHMAMVPIKYQTWTLEKIEKEIK